MMRSTDSSARHLHLAGHLAVGAALRCGCESATATDSAAPRAVPASIWVPVRRQLVGFVRTRFIYSDRRTAALAAVD